MKHEFQHNKQSLLKRIQPLLTSTNEKTNRNERLATALNILHEFLNVLDVNPENQHETGKFFEEKKLRLNCNVISCVRAIAYQLLNSKSMDAKNSLRDVYEFLPIHLEQLEPADLIFVATHILEAAFTYDEVA